MRVHIAELLEKLGLEDTMLYWGKRLVRALPQPGQFKSHSVVTHWHSPDQIRIELRAGLSGKTMTAKDLAQYPLQFQSETFFDFDVNDTKQNNQTKKDGKASGDTKGSKGGSGGKGLRRKLSDDGLSAAFAKTDEKIPTHATLVRGVIMGMEIGKSALETVFDMFCKQVHGARVLASDLLAAAGKAITRYTPPPFMEPKGNEDKVYRYSREKNDPMFGMGPA